MSIKSALPCIVSLVFVACGGSAPAPDAPQTDPAQGKADMAPEPVAEKPADDGAGAAAGGEKKEEKKEEKKAETAPKLDKPKSGSTIGGKSISEIDGLAVQGEAKKLGWTKDGAAVGGATMGSYEQFRFEIEKGKAKGFVEIVRPAASPGPAGGGSIVPPAELKGTREKDGAAVHLDEASDVIVIVSIEGKTADAKKLLGQLVKMAKAEKKAEAKAEKAEAKAEAKPEPKKAEPAKPEPKKAEPAKK